MFRLCVLLSVLVAAALAQSSCVYTDPSTTFVYDISPLSSKSDYDIEYDFSNVSKIF